MPLLQVRAMLGGTGAQIGWFLLGFGSLFFWAFACGASYALQHCVSQGPVAVEYLRPRIAGMRRRPLSPWATLAALLPAVGLCLAIAGLFKGRWGLRLLR